MKIVLVIFFIYILCELFKKSKLFNVVESLENISRVIFLIISIISILLIITFANRLGVDILYIIPIIIIIIVELLHYYLVIDIYVENYADIFSSLLTMAWLLVFIILLIVFDYLGINLLYILIISTMSQTIEINFKTKHIHH